MLLGLDAADAEGSEAHIAPRREPNAYAPPRPDVLHCYGVDFLSTKDVVDLLRDYGPQQVEWLDDSSCNVVFESAEAAHSCLSGLSEVAACDSPEVAGLPVLDDEGWIRTRPLKLRQEEQKARRGGPAKQRAQREHRLQLRVACEADRKNPGHSGHTDSAYYSLVKEQQAQQKQAQEARMLKKRRRRSLLPGAAGQPEEADLEDDSWADGPAAPAPTPSPFAAPAGTAAAAPEEERGPFGAPAPAAAAAASPFAAAGAGAAPDGAAAAAPSLRLGLRGALDPLAFLRAPGEVASSTGAPAAPAAARAAEVQRRDADLRSALRRAEEEFTSLLLPEPAQAQPAPSAAGGRAGAAGPAARARRRALGRGAGAPEGDGALPPRARRAGTPPPASVAAQGQQRGRKRRPVEQEPRPVSGAEPPKRRVEALPEVENFLAQHRVRCQRYAIHRTFRSITFACQQQRKKAQLAKGTGEDAAQAQTSGVKCTDGGGASSTASGEQPWEQYLKANSGFTKNGQFMHTVAFQANGRHILVTIPHPTRTDMDKLARAVQRPKESIRVRKLGELTKTTGFPVFVCPPFGHPKDEEGMEPILLVDSTVTELKKPLLFDCGSVGLSIPVSEFFRCTGAACIEGLGYIPEPSVAAQAVRELQLKGAREKETTPQEQSPRSVLEPAPEPAPLAPPPGTWVPGGGAAGGGALAAVSATPPGQPGPCTAPAEDVGMGL